MQRILFVALFVLPLIAADPSPQQPSEDDWWLPAWATPKPEVVGFFGPNPDDVPVADQPLELVTFRWKDVNPREGVYDWSILREALAGDRPIHLRIENSHVVHCPDWLESKYPELRGLILQGDAPQYDNWDVDTGGTYYPLWHAGFRAEFRRLLADFRAQGFGGHARLRFMYIPGAWAWGEFGVQFVDEMAATGVAPADFLAWWRDVLDAYVDAFGPGNAYKLMYTGHDHLPLCASSDSARQTAWRNAIGRSLFTEVMARGGSTRWGLLEKFNFLAGDLPNYGLPAVEIGGRFYQVADETSPLLADPKRLIGSENEEIANGNIPWDNYYQLKMTALRSLQLRVNRVFTNRDLWAKAQPLHQYLLRSLDRRPADSPDAWCALRRGRDVYQEWSRYHLGWRGPWYLDNWERWLWQREVEPDGRSVLTTPVDVPVPFNEDNWEARRTDHAGGSDHLYFWVEDRFLHGGSNRVQVKVTYLDDGAAAWWLEYDAADGDPRKRTASRINQADGAWRTVTFDLPDASFQGRQREGADFRLCNGGQRDLTVRFVRVIRLDEPVAAPTPGGGGGNGGGGAGGGGGPVGGGPGRVEGGARGGCGAGSVFGVIVAVIGLGWWSARRR